MADPGGDDAIDPAWYFEPAVSKSAAGTDRSLNSFTRFRSSAMACAWEGWRLFPSLPILPWCLVEAVEIIGAAVAAAGIDRVQSEG